MTPQLSGYQDGSDSFGITAAAAYPHENGGGKFEKVFMIVHGRLFSLAVLRSCSLFSCHPCSLAPSLK
jgi:hypothetical protein